MLYELRVMNQVIKKQKQEKKRKRRKDEQIYNVTTLQPPNLANLIFLINEDP